MSYDSREKSRYDGVPVECYRFVLGSTIYLWTSADAPITLSTGVYAPVPISRTQITQSQEDSSDAVQVKLPKDSPIVAPFLPYVPGSAVGLTIYRAHRGDEGLAHPIFIGTVASVVVRDTEATLTCSPFGGALERAVPSLTCQPRCNWPLYGAGCQVNVASFTDHCLVSSVTGVTVVSTAFAAHVDQWYRNGWMRNSAGEIRFIVKHIGNTITLMNPFPLLAAGQFVDAIAGCDRTEATCTSKFNNFVRHMGFPRMLSRNPFLGPVA